MAPAVTRFSKPMRSAVAANHRLVDESLQVDHVARSQIGDRVFQKRAERQEPLVRSPVQILPVVELKTARCGDRLGGFGFEEHLCFRLGKKAKVRCDRPLRRTNA